MAWCAAHGDPAASASLGGGPVRRGQPSRLFARRHAVPRWPPAERSFGGRFAPELAGPHAECDHGLEPYGCVGRGAVDLLLGRRVRALGHAPAAVSTAAALVRPVAAPHSSHAICVIGQWLALLYRADAPRLVSCGLRRGARVRLRPEGRGRPRPGARPRQALAPRHPKQLSELRGLGPLIPPSPPVPAGVALLEPAARRSASRPP
mmetsp:Transcript_91841/g.263024  ORF Transcript_91841/g.263024 Transcript_91841/m.263024 type:complete len:206 (-) Transcript_91841:28-645(-)